MTDTAFAIDFGTSRTKVAWRDAEGKIEVLRFGGLDYIPSLFYIAPEDDILEMGAKAGKSRSDDPGGFIEQLKRKITSKTIRTTNGSVKPEKILEKFFCYIREQAINTVETFKQNGLPDEITLTLPANAEWELAGKLKMAAMKAGFAKTNEEYEPVAAARAWFVHEHTENKPLIVLDCGGGTTDWACVEPWEGRMRLSSKHQPAAINLGGVDVDEALLQWLMEQMPETFENLSDERLLSLRADLSSWKENVLSGNKPEQIRLRGKLIPLNEEITRKLYEEHYLKPLEDNLNRYIKQAESTYEDIELLIVGGAANNLLMKFMKEKKISSSFWNKNHLATIIGSLSNFDENNINPSSIRIFGKYNEPHYSSEAKDLLNTLNNPDGLPSSRICAYYDLHKLGIHRLGTVCDENGLPDIEWVEIPEGNFIFGKDKYQQELYSGHYCISRYPITRSQYNAFLDDDPANPKWWDGMNQTYILNELERKAKHRENFSKEHYPHLPYSNISWYEAIAFTRWLSQKLGYKTRLPTEQEWEKAARGPDARSFPWGNILLYPYNHSNVKDVSSFDKYILEHGSSEELNFPLLPLKKECKPVGVYPEGMSPYGVMDMSGNVWEWCLNKYSKPGIITTDHSDEARVVRGGSFKEYSKCARTYYREAKLPFEEEPDLGFRIVCFPKNNSSNKEIEASLNINNIIDLYGDGSAGYQKSVSNKLDEDEIKKNTSIYLANEVQNEIEELDSHLAPTYRFKRAVIFNRLYRIRDPRPGVGLNEDGLPDLNWLEVTEGSFTYGHNESIYLSKYFISQYAITLRQFTAFVNDTFEDPIWWQGIDAEDSIGSLIQWKKRLQDQNERKKNSYMFSDDNKPMTGISWFEAIAYARWLSAKLGYDVRLPTEQEWEKAARGTDAREYPWGNEYKDGWADLEDEISIEDHESSEALNRANNLPSERSKSVKPVGSFAIGRSPYGVMDMIGSVWEWCLNKIDYPDDIHADYSNDPRVLRGSSYSDPPQDSMTTLRHAENPDSSFNNVGFRLVCTKLPGYEEGK